MPLTAINSSAAHVTTPQIGKQVRSTEFHRMANYYSVLGVGIDASSDDIKRRYKKLALQFHPDKTGNPADTERFHAIQEAYDTLKDSTLRRQYNSKNNIYTKQTAYATSNTSSHTTANASGYNTYGYGYSHFTQSTGTGRGGYGGPSYFSYFQQNLRAYNDAFARNAYSEKSSERAYESLRQSPRESKEQSLRAQETSRPESRDNTATSAATAAKLANLALQQELDRRRREYMEAAARGRAKYGLWGQYDLEHEGDAESDQAYQRAKQYAHARHYTVYEVSESEDETPGHDAGEHANQNSGASADNEGGAESDPRSGVLGGASDDALDDASDAASDADSEDCEDHSAYFKQEHPDTSGRGYDLAEPIVVEDEDETTFYDAHPPVDGADTSLDPDATRTDSPDVVELGSASPLRRPRLASQAHAFSEHRNQGSPAYAVNGNKRTKFAGMGDLRASLGTGLDDVDFGDIRLTLPKTAGERKASTLAQPSAKRAKLAEYSDGRSRAQTLFTPINTDFRRTSNGTISTADLAPEHNDAELVFQMAPPTIDTAVQLTAEKWAAHVEQLQKYERAFAAYRLAVFRYQLGRFEKDERHRNIIFSDTSCLDVYQTCLFNDMLILQNYTRALQEFKDTLRQFCRDSAAVNAMT